MVTASIHQPKPEKAIYLFSFAGHGLVSACFSQVISLMLQSLLFKKAVLDWDLKSERAYADGPMVLTLELRTYAINGLLEIFPNKKGRIFEQVP